MPNSFLIHIKLEKPLLPERLVLIEKELNGQILTGGRMELTELEDYKVSLDLQQKGSPSIKPTWAGVDLNLFVFFDPEIFTGELKLQIESKVKRIFQDFGAKVQESHIQESATGVYMA